eukprot:scaffold75536_cov17-Tisochrysis_lutea.AAC.3
MQVRRVLKDFFKKGWAGTRSVPCLLRVPWLEIETEEAFEWSLDGEPAAHPSTSLRLSLLHRAILAHLPDDRMLMAGNEDAGVFWQVFFAHCQPHVSEIWHWACSEVNYVWNFDGMLVHWLHFGLLMDC